MVIQALPTIKAIEKALMKLKVKKLKSKSKTKPEAKSSSELRSTTGAKIIFFSPGGKQFDTTYAKKTAKKYSDIIIICGRYEGIDARVKKAIKIYSKVEEVSVGPFVLTGGELPAMILIDSISRQIPGVLGKYESLEEERVSSSEVYTRPEILKYKVPGLKYPLILSHLGYLPGNWTHP